jgi:hypothetical protein
MSEYKSVNRKNLKIHEETYDLLKEHKRKGESWDLLFTRLAESWE